MSGREGGMQTASGTLSHAVASSSTGTRRSSTGEFEFPLRIYGQRAVTDDGHVAVRPTWGVDMDMTD